VLRAVEPMETVQSICNFFLNLEVFVTENAPSLDTLSKIGPFLSGISLVATAFAAWATLHYFHRRTLYNQWVDGFRVIYAEFWKDETISYIRRSIASDQEYKRLQEALGKRLAASNNDLGQEDNLILEDIDKFLAFMARVSSFNKSTKMDKWQKQLWQALYESYWLRKMYSRREMRIYIRTYWRNLYDWTYRKEFDDSNVLIESKSKPREKELSSQQRVSV
jgi:hypothetical protein